MDGLPTGIGARLNLDIPPPQQLELDPLAEAHHYAAVSRKARWGSAGARPKPREEAWPREDDDSMIADGRHPQAPREPLRQPHHRGARGGQGEDVGTKECGCPIPPPSTLLRRPFPTQYALSPAGNWCATTDYHWSCPNSAPHRRRPSKTSLHPKYKEHRELPRTPLVVLSSFSASSLASKRCAPGRHGHSRLASSCVSQRLECSAPRGTSLGWPPSPKTCYRRGCCSQSRPLTCERREMEGEERRGNGKVR
jgi:hypothetical protein